MPSRPTRGGTLPLAISSPTLDAPTAVALQHPGAERLADGVGERQGGEKESADWVGLGVGLRGYDEVRSASGFPLLRWAIDESYARGWGSTTKVVLPVKWSLSSPHHAAFPFFSPIDSKHVTDIDGRHSSHSSTPPLRPTPTLSRLTTRPSPR